MTMNPIGDNERIEPTLQENPWHLHEKTGFGQAAQSKKDPGEAINPGSNNYTTISGGTLLPPDLMPIEFPPFPLPPPGPIIPGPAPDPTEPPPTPPVVGDFVYFNGAWWAAVEYSTETGELVEPYWFQFAPPVVGGGGGGGGDTVSVLRYNLDNGNVEYWDGSDWVSWSTLPTSDPGGGAIWLSAT